MLDAGEVRVGTFEDYRRMEDSARGDSTEGIRRRIDRVALARSDDELPESLRGIFSIGHNRGAMIDGYGVTESRIVDAFMYCTTGSFNEQVMVDAYKADACVRITQPVPFLLRSKCVRRRNHNPLMVGAPPAPFWAMPPYGRGQRTD